MRTSASIIRAGVHPPPLPLRSRARSIKTRAGWEKSGHQGDAVCRLSDHSEGQPFSADNHGSGNDHGDGSQWHWRIQLPCRCPLVPPTRTTDFHAVSMPEYHISSCRKHFSSGYDPLLELFSCPSRVFLQTSAFSVISASVLVERLAVGSHSPAVCSSCPWD